MTPARVNWCSAMTTPKSAIRRRLEIYEAVTAPLVDWYREQGLLATVDAVGSPDEVTERVVAAVEAQRQYKAVR